MKKILSILIIVVLMINLVGCENSLPELDNDETSENQEEIINGDVEEEKVEDLLTIENYYPFKENMIMDYEGIGNEYAEQKTFIEFIEGNRAQIKVMNPGTNMVRIIEYKDGILKEIFSEGEFYHIENMLDVQSSGENIILQEPLEIGNSWPTEDGNSKEITSIDATIETPSGTYKALEVTTTMTSDAIEKEYFVEGIGLVASIYIDGDFEVKTLLKEIIEDEETIELVSYYPTLEDIGTEYIKQNINFATNEKIENILEMIMKESPNDKLMPSISKNTKINKVSLNRSSQTVEIDFSEELVTEMTGGSSLEWEMLKSIVNTLGDFYDVEKVYISIEDEAYESGHYGIMEDEYFEVDKEGISEFKE